MADSMTSFQISCVGGQCTDPSCGVNYVVINGIRVSADDLIAYAEEGRHSYWTMVGDRAVPVIVHTYEDGSKRLLADLREFEGRLA